LWQNLSNIPQQEQSEPHHIILSLAL
jgi:hypothetical protein